MLRVLTGISLLTLVYALAYSSVGPTSTGRDAASEPARAGGAQRTLVILRPLEPPSLAAKPFAAVALTAFGQVRIFTATLDYNDEQEVTHPYLAEALPELNTATWRALSDGTTETTYHLRPGLTSIALQRMR